jgi:hypothetical protein
MEEEGVGVLGFALGRAGVTPERCVFLHSYVLRRPRLEHRFNFHLRCDFQPTARILTWPLQVRGKFRRFGLKYWHPSRA